MFKPKVKHQMKGTVKKSLLLKSLIVILIGITVYSCNDKNNPSEPETKPGENNASSKVTEADAAKIATNSILVVNSGLVHQVVLSVKTIATQVTKCGVQQTIPVKGSNQAGAAATYSFDLTWISKLNCASSLPTQMDLSFKGDSKYDSAELNGKNKESGKVTVTGFLPPNDPFLVTTADTVISTHTIKGNSGLVVDSKLFVKSASNILVQKGTYAIVSGVVNITLTGSTTGGQPFEYKGTITFKGNKQATLQITGGRAYQISW
jgi:hypothetical protein